MEILSVVLTIFAFFGSSHAVANGTVEDIFDNPWQAKLYAVEDISSMWPCGGTLISQNYVLTSARCFTYQRSSQANGVLVYLGVWDVAKIDGNVVRREIDLADVIIHDGYNGNTYENDIALIKLPKAVNYTDRIQPAKLAAQKNVEIGNTGHISGWQYPQREWDESHQYIHGGDVTIVDNSVCRDTYPNYAIDKDSMCALGSVAFCYGDEGIGLQVNGEIVGMAYGAKEVKIPLEECPILPQPYLSIPKYLDWIKANSDYKE